MFKLAFATVVLAGVLIAGVLWFKAQKTTELPPLKTVEVEKGDVQFTIDATGTVEPEEVVDVGAQVAGKISSLGVDPRDPKRTIDYGSPVRVGTVLARIDDALYQSDVQQAQAQVNSAQAMAESMAAQVLESEANVQRAEKDLLQIKAKLFSAERDWRRAEGLWKTSPGAISESDYDLAKSTYDAADAAVGVGVAAIAQANAMVTNSKASVLKARADLSNSQAMLGRAQTNLGYCTIKSPVDGVIIDRRINMGQTVVSSLNSPSLFLIAKDLKRLQVWASVNEADIGHIHSGQGVRFNIDGAKQTFDGVVAPDQPRLNASMNQNVVTYTVVVNTDNSAGLLLPYRTADLHFLVDRHEGVLLVPSSALRWKPSAERLAASGLPPLAELKGKAAAAHSEAEPDGISAGSGTVWLADGNRVKPVKVQTGLSDGTHIEIAAAELPAGTKLAIGEESNAGDGQTTNPFSPQVFGGGGKRPQQ